MSQGAVPAMVRIYKAPDVGLATKMSISCALGHLTSTYDCCPQIVKQHALPVADSSSAPLAPATPPRASYLDSPPTPSTLLLLLG